MRILYFVFSIFAYVIGIGSMAAFFFFVRFYADNNLVSFSWNAVLWNCLVFLIFPLQHSILARRFVKQKIPAELTRSIYVASSGVAMWIVLLQWNRFGPILFNLPFPWIVRLLYYITVLAIIWTTREIDHWRMFGIAQGYAAWKRKNLPELDLKTHGIYARIRHPLTTLFIVAVWCHPTMSAGRLLFNLLFTAYALAGTIFEERDLRKSYGEAYWNYEKRVPAFVPRWKR